MGSKAPILRELKINHQEESLVRGLKYRGVIALCLLFGAFVTGVHAETSANIKSLQFERLAAEIKVTIEIEGEYSYQTFEMTGPNRLVVEITPVGRIDALPSYTIQEFGIAGVRTGQFQPGVVRVVFDMTDKFPFYKINQVAKNIELSFWQGPEVAGEKVVAEAPAKIGEAAAEGRATDLKAITFERLAVLVRVNIRLDGPFMYHVVGLNEASQIIVDVSGVSRLSAPASVDVNAEGIKKVTAEKLDPSTVRIAFNLAAPAPSFKFRRTDSTIEAEFWIVPGAKPIVQARAAQPEARRYAAERPEARRIHNTMAGLFAGNYNVSDPVFEEVYKSGGLIYGFELSRVLYATGNLNLGLSLEARNFGKTGTGTVLQDEAKLRITPLTFAAKCYIAAGYFIPYVGAGLDYYMYKETAGEIETTGSTLGLHFQGGLLYQIPGFEALKLKVYGKYTIADESIGDPEEEPITVKLGGLEFGAGLVFGFDFPK